MIGRVHSIKKRVNHLSCIEGKGGLKDIYCIARNGALFVDLLLNLFLCDIMCIQYPHLFSVALITWKQNTYQNIRDSKNRGK